MTFPRARVSPETHEAARKCTKMQRDFAERWVRDPKNAGAKAEAVGVTKKRAKVTASEWHKNPRVRRYIAALESDMALEAGRQERAILKPEAESPLAMMVKAEDVVVSGAHVLRRATEIAFLDMADFWTAEPMFSKGKDGAKIPVLNEDGSPAMRLYFDFDRARQAGKTNLIQEITVAKDGSLIPHFPDKKAHLELLAKALGIGEQAGKDQQERLWAAFLATLKPEQLHEMHRNWLKFGEPPALPPANGNGRHDPDFEPEP